VPCAALLIADAMIFLQSNIRKIILAPSNNIVLLLLLYRLLFHLTALYVAGAMRVSTILQCTVTAQRFGGLFSFSETFIFMSVDTYTRRQHAGCLQ
jgi:hypothetical protein